MGDRPREQRGWRIRGRVQGVGYRFWAVRIATALGASGTVRNCIDGSVELHAAAPPEVLVELERRLWEGPTLARVDAVERIPSTTPLPEGDFRVVW